MDGLFKILVCYVIILFTKKAILIIGFGGVFSLVLLP